MAVIPNYRFEQIVIVRIITHSRVRQWHLDNLRISIEVGGFDLIKDAVENIIKRLVKTF